MMKLMIIVVLSLLFNGWSIVYSDVKQAYVDTKVVYQDAKYVVFEVMDEIENLENEKKSNAQVLQTLFLLQVVAKMKQ